MSVDKEAVVTMDETEDRGQDEDMQEECLPRRSSDETPSLSDEAKEKIKRAQMDAKLRKMEEVALRKVFAKLEDFADCDVELTYITSNGANYTSALYKVTITRSSDEKEHLFAKIANLSESIRPQMQGDRMFNIERIFYNHLSGYYHEVQDKYGIPYVDQVLFPKFYGSSDEHLKETIILEDLTLRGFTTYDRFKPADWEYASAAVGTMAKFHALSLVCNFERADDMKKINEVMRVQMPVSGKVIGSQWRSMAAGAFEVVPEELRGELNRFLDEQLTQEQFERTFGPRNKQMLVHGDYKSSNLMHKYQDGRLIVMPIDFQTMRMGCPVLDIMYFVFKTTDERFRATYFRKLLDHYYITFTKFLALFNLDSSVLYSRQDFDGDCNEFLPYGLIVATCFLPILLVSSSEAPRINTEGSALKNFAVKPNDIYRERYMGILNDYIRWGFIKKN